jgi:catechol 2,3-dioxygenase-like lactoylglutathione lyase family enzyme
MMPGMILEHVNMIVKNRDESIDFYIKVMGFKLLRKYETDTQRVAYLYLDDQLLELNELYAQDQPLGLSHLGFRVDDMDEAMAELKKRDIEFLRGPIKIQPKIYATANVIDDKLKRALKPIKNPYWRVSIFRDPNGVTIELLER